MQSHFSKYRREEDCLENLDKNWTETGIYNGVQKSEATCENAVTSRV